MVENKLVYFEITNNKEIKQLEVRLTMKEGRQSEPKSDENKKITESISQ